tara:strand:- start:38986 stop:39618 length:633 start_codon:yes stop_codon:yes gene_type:complete
MAIPETHRIYQPDDAWFIADHQPAGPAGHTGWPTGAINDYTGWLTNPSYEADYIFGPVEMGPEHARFMSHQVTLFGLVTEDPGGNFVLYDNACEGIYIDFGTDPDRIPTKGTLYWQDSGNGNGIPWDTRPMKTISDWLRIEFTSDDIVDGKLLLELPLAKEFRQWFTLAIDSIAGGGIHYRVKEIKFLTLTSRSFIGSSKDLSPPHTKVF